MVLSLSCKAWSKESNWIGYVAMSTDAAVTATGQRVIYVVWRSTIRMLEWVDTTAKHVCCVGWKNVFCIGYCSQYYSHDTKIVVYWYRLLPTTPKINFQK
jgi:hypothetical protein